MYASKLYIISIIHLTMKSLSAPENNYPVVPIIQASPVAQEEKCPPEKQEMQETQVLPLGQEDPLEEEMATHSSIFAGKIPWAVEPGWLRSIQL